MVVHNGTRLTHKHTHFSAADRLSHEAARFLWLIYDFGILAVRWRPSRNCRCCRLPVDDAKRTAAAWNQIASVARVVVLFFLAALGYMNVPGAKALTGFFGIAVLPGRVA